MEENNETNTWDIDNGCAHDWRYLQGDEGVMFCAHCDRHQN